MTALGFIFTIRGIPFVYYGTEQGFTGCDDPYNREDMFSSFNASSTLYTYIKTLNTVKRAHPALQDGFQQERYVTDTFYAFQRSSGTDEVVVCINNSWGSQTINVPSLSNLANGTVLTDRVNGGTVTVNNGTIPCSMAAKQTRVYTK